MSSAPIPMLDLKAQFATIKDEIMNAVTPIFENQTFIMGAPVEQAEKALARYTGSRHAIGVSSGTDALILSLMALGVGPGDAVITTPFTFFATVGSVVRLGAKPIFVDIDPETYNLDPAKLADTLDGGLGGAKPKVIIPVHLFGQCADMDPILKLADEHGIAVLEDAAQAIGASYPGQQGDTQAGAMGTLGSFSFFPSKNLGAAGDGGLITCQDDDLAAKLKSMRNHGSHPAAKYRHIHVGGNFRLDALQAAVVQAKLPHLDAWHEARRANAARYNELFRECGLVDAGKLSTPREAWPEVKHGHIYNQYVIRVQQRDAVDAALSKAQIGHAIYYPIPMHLLECFADLGGREGDYPISEQAAHEVLAIPVYPELSSRQQERIVQVIAGALK
jgi:dTDP-4-amino-4,6-dideoxygalactose transaminase